MNQDIIWDYYQNQRPELFEGSYARLSYLTRRIPLNSKVLNIGVGAGVFEELGLARGLDVYSLDPVPATIENIRNRFSLATKAQVGYIQSIPFPNEFFDAVVVSEVLEHLPEEDVKVGLEEIHRVLRQGGRIVGTVPAREDISKQIIVCPACATVFHRWGHVQSFDPTTVRGLLSTCFEVEEISERPFITWSTLNWKGKVSALAKLLLHKIGIHGSNENIVFIARKPGR